MRMQEKIEGARRFIQSKTGQDRLRLQRICRKIQQAQNELHTEAAGYYNICVENCRGVCCKNILVNDVVTQLDLIFVMTMEEKLFNQIQTCANAETLFSADCLFLENGVGPCIFPGNTKPERCVRTFCGDVRPIRREIRAVKAGFRKLSRFAKIRRPFLWLSFRL